MYELKPCPFCGGEAELTVFCDFRGDIAKAYAYCVNCNAYVGIFSKEEYAIEAWNTRYERTCTMKHEGERNVDDSWECSLCHAIHLRLVQPRYCPGCGARVIGVE